MKDLLKKILSKKERQAVELLKKHLEEKFGKVELILFGSKARGEGHKESDIDLLVLLDMEVDNKVREEIFGIAFEVMLKYDVVFGILVRSRKFWQSPRAKVMPIYKNIELEGVRV